MRARQREIQLGGERVIKGISTDRKRESERETSRQRVRGAGIIFFPHSEEYDFYPVSCQRKIHITYRVWPFLKPQVNC